MAPTERPLTRRRALALGAGGAVALALAGCKDKSWYGTDVTGTLPDLDFSMTRVSDGRAVSEADYRGQFVALFFGYTFCPDICPMTLANLSALADRLGEQAGQLSILFATVDPERDTPDILAEYLSHFTPRADGLYGTANQLAALTRRYRVTYRVADHAPGDADYEVSHGKSVYIFAPDGRARLLWTAFDTGQADIDKAKGDLERLFAGA